MRIVMILVVLTSALVACDKKKADNKDKPVTTASGSDTGQGSAPAPGSGSDTAQGSGSDTAQGSAAAGSGSAAPTEVAMTKGAGNCPSTVLGATTKAEVKGKDVILTISATDKDAIASIQKRAEELIKQKSDGATSGAVHDKKGGHGGGMGLCPVHWTEGGSAKQKKDAKGVVVTITPKEKPEDLKTLIDARIAKAEAWVKENIKPGEQGNRGGVGGGKGDHGSTHEGSGDGKGQERKGEGPGDGAGKGGGTGKGDGKGGGKNDKTNKGATKPAGDGAAKPGGW